MFFGGDMSQVSLAVFGAGLIGRVHDPLGIAEVDRGLADGRRAGERGKGGRGHEKGGEQGLTHGATPKKEIQGS